MFQVTLLKVLILAAVCSIALATEDISLPADLLIEESSGVKDGFRGRVAKKHGLMFGAEERNVLSGRRTNTNNDNRQITGSWAEISYSDSQCTSSIGFIFVETAGLCSQKDPDQYYINTLDHSSTELTIETKVYSDSSCTTEIDGFGYSQYLPINKCEVNDDGNGNFRKVQYFPDEVPPIDVWGSKDQWAGGMDFCDESACDSKDMAKLVYYSLRKRDSCFGGVKMSCSESESKIEICGSSSTLISYTLNQCVLSLDYYSSKTVYHFCGGVDNSSSSKDDSSSGGAVGGAIGGVFFVLALCAGYYFYKQKQNKDTVDAAEATSSSTGGGLAAQDTARTTNPMAKAPATEVSNHKL